MGDRIPKHYAAAGGGIFFGKLAIFFKKWFRCKKKLAFLSMLELSRTFGNILTKFSRFLVKQGKEAVDAALQSEWCTCPRGEKGKRRRRTACARDVAGWLWLRFRVKFCLKTVTADLREIKINSM